MESNILSNAVVPVAMEAEHFSSDWESSAQHVGVLCKIRLVHDILGLLGCNQARIESLKLSNDRKVARL